MEERFNEFGMWRMPEKVEKVAADAPNQDVLTLGAVFCSKGHNLVSPEETLHGQAGIRLAFVRPNGEEGLVVISTRLGDITKHTLKGELVRGERVALSCPVCNAALPVLAQCDRCHTGDMCVLFASEKLSIEDSVAFCNVVGCPNAMLIHSDTIIRALGRDSL